MNQIKDIETEEELNSLLAEKKAEKKPFFLLKHSTTCPISSQAHRNVEVFQGQHPEVPVYRVLVIESRPLSNHIAELFKITHQSPQIFLILNGVCCWHSSHMAITETEMGKQLASLVR